MNEIPKEVIEAAKNLIELYGENIKALGTYKDQEVYKYQFPKNSFTGFPFVYLYDKVSGQVFTITGFDALDILSSIE